MSHEICELTSVKMELGTLRMCHCCEFNTRYKSDRNRFTCFVNFREEKRRTAGQPQGFNIFFNTTLNNSNLVCLENVLLSPL